MERSAWWYTQLQSSLEGFLWAIEQVPDERHFISRRPERWSVARITFHVGWYERHIALPAMRQWLGGPALASTSQEEDAAREEQEWNDGQGHTMLAMIKELRALRMEESAIAANTSPGLWDEDRPALWGEVSLHWIMTKTYQHTLEHTDEILRQYLWWR